MAKIVRKAAKIFGSSAGFQQIGIVGSFAAGAPAYSTDPEVIQSLSNYLGGWFDCIEANDNPAIEDMNALMFLFAYQIAYLLQDGIPEWNATTTYYMGSCVKENGCVFMSLSDNNLNQPRTSAVSWKVLGGSQRTVIATDSATIYDEYLRLDPTAGTFTQTLPQCSLTPQGKEITLKNVADNGAVVTVKGFASELIDASNSLVLNSTTAGVGSRESVTLRNTGGQWDII